MKLTKKYYKNKCEKLLTPISLKINPNCLLCGNIATVGHHFVFKSTSTRLRYYLPNIISLCQKCHYLLHQNKNQTLYSGRIIEKMGLDWFRDIESKKHEIVKADKWFYLENYNRLQKEYIYFKD
jgi:5-methylcytosine-specific restriction endonuclease McrA